MGEAKLPVMPTLPRNMASTSQPAAVPLGFLLGRIMGLQPPDLLRGEAVQGPVEAEISRLGQEGGHGLLVLRRLAVLVLAELVALHDLLIVALQLGLLQLLGQVPGQSLTLPGQLRRGGMEKKDAIIESGKTRLRPILMTALTTILSMSTMAVGLGEGSEMMQPMAIVTVGGLLYGTLLTLIVVPCIYDAFNRNKSMVEEDL